MILTVFCKKLKVVSSVFLMMKNVVALSFCSTLPIKLNCYVVSESANSVCLIKSIAISL